jgi:hypothetical protein
LLQFGCNVHLFGFLDGAFWQQNKTKSSIGSKQFKLITNPATFSAGGFSFCSPTAELHGRRRNSPRYGAKGEVV